MAIFLTCSCGSKAGMTLSQNPVTMEWEWECWDCGAIYPARPCDIPNED